MEVCDCNVGLSNTGRPGCVPIQAVTSSLILVQTKNSAGVKNGIDLSAPMPTWSDLINATDASERWFPLPPFEDVTLPKADSLFAEAASGRKAKLRQGKRSFAGDLWEEDSSPTMLGKIEAASCVDFSFWIVDVSGNLIGSYDSAANYLYPIPVDAASWDPKLMMPTDSDVSKIHLEFDWYRLFDESTLKMLTVAEAGQNFTELEGLIDVVFTNEASSVAALNITFTAKFEYGTALNAIKYIGATLVGDWSVYNNTQLAAIVPTLVTEATDGNYALDVPALSIVIADSITVSVAKDGFSGSVDIVVAA